MQAQEVKLERPIATHQGSMAVLKLQPLTAGVMMKHRVSPITIVRGPDGTPPQEIIDYDLAGKYLAELTGIDEITLGMITPTDFRNAILVIAQMFYGFEPKN